MEYNGAKKKQVWDGSSSHSLEKRLRFLCAPALCFRVHFANMTLMLAIIRRTVRFQITRIKVVVVVVVFGPFARRKKKKEGGIEVGEDMALILKLEADRTKTCAVSPLKARARD
jgi:hypothetical protein